MGAFAAAVFLRDMASTASTAATPMMGMTVRRARGHPSLVTAFLTIKPIATTPAARFTTVHTSTRQG